MIKTIVTLFSIIDLLAIILGVVIVWIIRITIFKWKADYLAKRIADEVGDILEDFKWNSSASIEPKMVGTALPTEEIKEHPIDEIEEIKELLK